uniref:Uncharacterized protein n=1 Tax=Amphimedon queenslandica TaxID=400682 RepID=A0A1X7TZK8_AMPQE
MYGQYYREMREGADIHKTWTWLQKSDIKPETDRGSYLCRTRTGIETNYIKCKIDGSNESPLCHLCREKVRLCGKFDMERGRNWYDHKPEGIIETVEVKI